jgi:small-conductance mechanosensitive channel
LLEEGEDEELLEEGEEPLELESGDDLAQKALAEANSAALPAMSSRGNNNALGESLTSLQNVIERNVDLLDELKDQLKQYRESLKNLFENDTELSTAEEQVSTMTQKVKERKTKIQGSAEAMQLKAHISEVNDQKKEIEEALNNHFLNLYQITGAKTFDTSSGEQREFNIRASVKGKKNPKAA